MASAAKEKKCVTSIDPVDKSKCLGIVKDTITYENACVLRQCTVPAMPGSKFCTFHLAHGDLEPYVPSTDTGAFYDLKPVPGASDPTSKVARIRAQISAQNAKVAERIQSLFNQIVSNQKTIAGYEVKLKDLKAKETELAERQTTIDELRKKGELDTTQIARAQKTIEQERKAHDKETKLLQGQLAKANKTLADQQYQLTNYEESFQLYEVLRQANERSVSKANTERDACKAELEKTQKELRDTITSLNKEIHARDEQVVAGLAREVDTIKKLSKVTADKKSLEAEKESLEDQIKTLEDRLNALKGTNARKEEQGKQQTEQVKDELKKCEVLQSQLKAQVNKLTDEKSKVVSDASDATHKQQLEISDYKHRLSMAEIQISELQTTNKFLQGQRDDAIEKKKYFEKHANEHAEWRLKFFPREAKLIKELSETNAQLDQSRKDIEASKEDATVKLSKITELEKANEELQRKFQQLQAEIEEARKAAPATPVKKGGGGWLWS